MIHINVDQDIKVFYIEASSFPDGVMEAFQKLHGLPGFSMESRNFGISKKENDKKIYKVAAEELHKGDLQKHGLKEFTIQKGGYLGIEVENYITDDSQIQKAFDQLLTHPELDPNSYCIEEYVSLKNAICMVKLK